MVVQLNVQNRLPVPIVLNSQSASGQPIVPQQSLQVTFELRENARGVAELHLYIDPQ
jgi:hypothetical protein